MNSIICFSLKIFYFASNEVKPCLLAYESKKTESNVLLMTFCDVSITQFSMSTEFVFTILKFNLFVICIRFSLLDYI